MKIKITETVSDDFEKGCCYDCPIEIVKEE